MPRPRCCRRISGSPPVATGFDPCGNSRRGLEVVVLTLDELEALRLADLEGLYQEQAAERMGISRPTFGRVVAEARRKVAAALVGGRPLRIEGGVVEQAELGEGDEEKQSCPRCAAGECRRGKQGRRCSEE